MGGENRQAVSVEKVWRAVEAKLPGYEAVAVVAVAATVVAAAVAVAVAVAAATVENERGRRWEEQMLFSTASFKSPLQGNYCSVCKYSNCTLPTGETCFVNTQPCCIESCPVSAPHTVNAGSCTAHYLALGQAALLTLPLSQAGL